MNADRKSRRSTGALGVYAGMVELSSGRMGQDALLAGLWVGAHVSTPKPPRKAAPAAVRAGSSRLRSPKLPAEGRSREGVHTDDNGSLGYKLFLSSAPRARPPLFVMLHGASQTASDFATGTRMQQVVEECGGIALFPEQTRSAHPMGSWNWYDARHQAAQGGEPLLITALTRKIAVEHAVDPRRIYVAGMSAGGAMAVILGQAFPDVYAAAGVHSGLAKGAAHDLLSALRTMNSGPSEARTGQREPAQRVPTIVFHGDSDRTVHPLDAVAVLAQAQRPDGGSAGAASKVDIRCTGPTPLPGGREVTLTTHRRQRKPAHAELWIVHGSGHAWTGGSAEGSYTDASGPDASREMLRFFLSQSLTRGGRHGEA